MCAEERFCFSKKMFLCCKDYLFHYSLSYLSPPGNIILLEGINFELENGEEK